MKPLYTAATDTLDMVDGKASFLLPCGGLGIHVPPVSSEMAERCHLYFCGHFSGNQNMHRARWWIWSPLELLPESQDVKDLLTPQATPFPTLSPFLLLQSVAMGKTASKGIWFLCVHLSPNNLVKCRCFPLSKSWPFHMIVRRNIFLEKRKIVCF